MARVWRDGQKHTVYIYRLLTTGQRRFSNISQSETVTEILSIKEREGMFLEIIRSLKIYMICSEFS